MLFTIPYTILSTWFCAIKAHDNTHLFENMDSNKQTDSRKLLSGLTRKIAFNGIHGNLLRWFKFYSIGHKKIVIKGQQSRKVILSSGVLKVPLGPFLFSTLSLTACIFSRLQHNILSGKTTNETQFKNPIRIIIYLLKRYHLIHFTIDPTINQCGNLYSI